MPRCKWSRLLVILVCLGVGLILLSISEHVAREARKGREHAYLPASHFIHTWEGPRTLSQRSSLQVLLWTGYFGSAHWNMKNTDAFSHCPVNACTLTSDLSLVDSSDALLFNARNLHQRPPPSYRHPSQVWVLHNSEPPFYVYNKLGDYGAGFNWTSSYRRDADLHSPYGSFRRLPPQEAALAASWQDSHDVLAGKTRLVAWVVSNCKDYGHRYRFVQELERYLPVDKYGDCHGRPYPRDYKFEKLLQSYKFVLALENGLCRDYVTEKLWNALFRNQIPIVRGLADYAKVAPPYSYISAHDFPDTASLARHVLHVASNASLYRAYFRWARDYRIVSAGLGPLMCNLCAALHDTSRPAQVYTDMEGWLRQDPCPKMPSVLEVIWQNVDAWLYMLGF